jgi:hypothetical protein
MGKRTCRSTKESSAIKYIFKNILKSVEGLFLNSPSILSENKGIIYG